MRSPKPRLQVEELGSRILLSANPLIDPPDSVEVTAHTAAHRGVQVLPKDFDGLDGTLHGTVQHLPGMPDGGQRYTLRGSGKLGGLDKFTVTGSLHGTGFLAKGHAIGEL